MPLSKTLQAVDRQLREEHRKRSQEWAETAPMPEESEICRWCGGRLIALIDGQPATYCQRGCARNDEMPYDGHCDECHRQFRTGRPRAVLCFECDQRDAARHQAAHQTAGRTYQFERFRRGGWRA